MKYTNNAWYSVVVSILMVGFLLVITSWVFQLVLSELNDNRGRENYLRASAGAEWALELALLSIKDQWYGHYSSIENTLNNKSIILASNPLDEGAFKSNEVRISYDMDSKVSSYSGSLQPLGFDILPLFFIDETSTERKVEQLSFNIPWWESWISWNIISDNGGISWEWDFTSTTGVQIKSVGAGGFVIDNTNIEDFLSDTSRQSNYLILFNTNSSTTIPYNLTSWDPDTFFTKPRAEIISSAQVGKYRQNFRTVVDNTEYLNVLKYSVFSN